MTTTHYVRIRGRVSGPFTENKLAVLVERGQLSRSHEVSEDGQTWKPAGEIANLFGASKRGDGSGNQKGAKELESASAADAASSATPVVEKWYYAVGDQRRGPFAWSNLQESVMKGKIPPTALVWTEGMPDWQEVTKIPGLSLTTTGSPSSGSESLTWGDLLPVFRVFNDGSWTLPWVQCVAIAVLFPLIALEYHGKENLPLIWVAITFLFYFTLLWTAFFHWCISPSRVSRWKLIGVWLFTATLGVFGALVVGFVTQTFFLDALDEASAASLFKRLVGWTIAVGLIEEVGKLLAVLLLTKKLSVDKLPRTCAYMGVISGLSFGTIEAAFYTFDYALGHERLASANEDTYGVLFFTLMLRWICLPLLHAVWTGIAGFFVGLSYKAPKNQWSWIARGLLIAALLHGIYDVGAADSKYSWLMVFSAAVSLSLFIGYLRSEDKLSSCVEKYDFESSAA